MSSAGGKAFLRRSRVIPWPLPQSVHRREKSLSADSADFKNSDPAPRQVVENLRHRRIIRVSFFALPCRGVFVVKILRCAARIAIRGCRNSVDRTGRERSVAEDRGQNGRTRDSSPLVICVWAIALDQLPQVQIASICPSARLPGFALWQKCHGGVANAFLPLDSPPCGGLATLYLSRLESRRSICHKSGKKEFFGRAKKVPLRGWNRQIGETPPGHRRLGISSTPGEASRDGVSQGASSGPRHVGTFFGWTPKKSTLFQRPKKPKKSEQGGGRRAEGGAGRAEGTPITIKLLSTGEPPAS